MSSKWLFDLLATLSFFFGVTEIVVQGATVMLVVGGGTVAGWWLWLNVRDSGGVVVVLVLIRKWFLPLKSGNR